MHPATERPVGAGKAVPGWEPLTMSDNPKRQALPHGKRRDRPMAWRAPPSLTTFCREILPLLHEQTQGERLLRTVAQIVATDRWNSFDRFHETTQTLVRLYEEAGAAVEVHSFPTGGRLGSGRWVIHEATDVAGATLDVVDPVQLRVLDYQRNPWHV